MWLGSNRRFSRLDAHTLRGQREWVKKLVNKAYPISSCVLGGAEFSKEATIQMTADSAAYGVEYRNGQVLRFIEVALTKNQMSTASRIYLQRHGERYRVTHKIRSNTDFAEWHKQVRSKCCGETRPVIEIDDDLSELIRVRVLGKASKKSYLQGTLLVLQVHEPTIFDVSTEQLTALLRTCFCSTSPISEIWLTTWWVSYRLTTVNRPETREV
jgi:hypothetical protein